MGRNAKNFPFDARGKKVTISPAAVSSAPPFIPFLALLFIEVDNRSLEISFCLKQMLTSLEK